MGDMSLAWSGSWAALGSNECGGGCSPRRLHGKTPVGLSSIVPSATAMRAYPTRQVSWIIGLHLAQKLTQRSRSQEAAAIANRTFPFPMFLTTNLRMPLYPAPSLQHFAGLTRLIHGTHHVRITQAHSYYIAGYTCSTPPSASLSQSSPSEPSPHKCSECLLKRALTASCPLLSSRRMPIHRHPAALRLPSRA